MPTAVELKLDNILQSFLKLDGIDGRGEQASLRGAFLKIDADFSKLTGAPTTESFLKLDHKYDAVTDVIGNAFIKLSRDFDRIAEVGIKIDEVFYQTGGFGTPSSVDLPNPQADWMTVNAALKLDASDLKLFGDDFLKLDAAASSMDFIKLEAAAGGGAIKLSSDMVASEQDFLKLGQDFVSLGGDGATQLEGDFLKLGAALQTVGTQFGTLSTDLATLGGDLQGGSGGPIITSAVVSTTGGGTLGAGFMAVDNDFLGLDKAFSGVAGPTAETLVTLLNLGGGAKPSA
jgi:hypothetical protein